MVVGVGVGVVPHRKKRVCSARANGGWEPIKNPFAINQNQSFFQKVMEKVKTKVSKEQNFLRKSFSLGKLFKNHEGGGKNRTYSFMIKTFFRKVLKKVKTKASKDPNFLRKIFLVGKVFKNHEGGVKT